MNRRNQRRRPRRSTRSGNQLRAIEDSINALNAVTATRSRPVVEDPQFFRQPRRPKIHSFAVKVNKGYVTADGVGVTGALDFDLSDTPTPTDFTSLFDRYRIWQVQVEFLPLVAPFGASTTAANLPILITAIDYDDSTPPAAFSTLQQYGNSQVVFNQEYHKRVLTPKFALSAYSGVFGSFSYADPGAWIDSASPSVQYYGLKWATSPVTVVSGSYILYSIQCTYIIQCKDNI